MKWIPKLVSLVLLWGVVGGIIFFIEPELLRDVIIQGIYLPFFTILFLTLWYSLAIFTKYIWMSWLITATVVGGIFLTMLGLMHIGLVIILLLTFATQSWYIYKHR